jgi:hypothetical protein
LKWSVPTIIDEDCCQVAGGYNEALEITTHVYAANQPGKRQKTTEEAGHAAQFGNS